MNKSHLFCIILLAGIIDASPTTRFELDQTTKRVNLGKAQWEILTKEAESTCFKDALALLQSGCKNMNDEQQTRFALALASCHIEKSGLKAITCTPEMTLRDCTAPLVSQPIAYNAYTEFYTHAGNICFFLESDHFQEQVERNIMNLYHSVVLTVDTLLKMNNLTNSIYDQVGTAVKHEEALLKSQEELKDGIIYLHQFEEIALDQMSDRFNELFAVSQTVIQIAGQTLGFQEDLKAGQNLLSEQQVELLESHNRMFEDIIELTRKHVELHELADRSIGTQNKLLDMQSKLHQEQRIVTTLIREVESISTKANINLNSLMNNQQAAFDKTFVTLSSLAQQSEETVNRLTTQHSSIASELDKIINSMQTVAGFQKTILGEFFDIGTLVFYIMAALLVSLATSFPRTHSARNLLYLGLLGLYWFEFAVSFDPHSIWTLRKIFLVFVFMGVGGSVYMHKEQQVAQNSLIAELHSKIHKEEVARTAEFTLLRKEVAYIREKMEVFMNLTVKPPKASKSSQGNN